MLLRKKIYQFSLAAIVFACGSLFFVNATLAQTPPIDPNADNLIVNFTPDPLFNAGNFLPGDSRTGEAEVINGTDETKRIATEAINYPEALFVVPSDDLSRALVIIIREKGGNDLYGGSSSTGARTLFDFYKNGETYLSDISANGTEEYEFIISFPESEGDEWQGKTTSFDIIVGFQGEDGSGIITPPSGGGGGATPGLIIKNVIVYDITGTSAKFSWFTSYDATSRVIYCEEIKGCVLDLSDNLDNPPLYGYDYTTSEMHTPANANGVTYRGLDQGGIGMNEIGVTGLTPNTTYSYRAISHASPPTISRIHTFTTLAKADSGDEDDDDGDDKHTPDPSQEGNNSDTGSGAYSGIGGIVGAVSDFVDSILEGEEDKEKADEGEVAGTVDENGVEISGEAENEIAGERGKCPDYLLWLIALLLLIIIALLYYIYKNRKRKINNDLE